MCMQMKTSRQLDARLEMAIAWFQLVNLSQLKRPGLEHHTVNNSFITSTCLQTTRDVISIATGGLGES